MSTSKVEGKANESQKRLLTTLPLQPSYSSARGDSILYDFYIPALSQSIKYRRIAGFFSSNALAVAAKGIAYFTMNNNGTMQILCNMRLSESDLQTMEKTLDKVAEEFKVDVDHLEDELQKNHLQCLGWMLQQKKLEIKIGILDNPNGITHEKIGILEDVEGNQISFSGSENETWKGWLVNNEHFHVFRGWITGEEPHFKNDLLDFETYWNNEAYRASVFSLEQAIIEKLIEIAPKTDDEFHQISSDIIKKYNENRPIRKEKTMAEWPHKKQALEVFLNKKNGILEMATGTGKTSVAINIMNKLFTDNKINGAIISTFGNDLLDQWYDELSEKANDRFIIYRYYGDFREGDDFLLYNEGSILLINWENLDRVLRNSDVYPSKLLIIDEIHGFGSESNLKKLENKISPFEYRLGLSATSVREYDQTGNDFITSEIGPIIFKYRLEDAIEDGILCEFNYIPLKFVLNEDDKQGIKKAYATYSGNIKSGKSEYNSTIQLYMDLARVRKLSENKIPVFKEFIKSNTHLLRHCIIFVETMEYGRLVQDVIIDHTSDYHTYYNDDEKSNLIKFGKGELDLLLTCKRISQGIDIRSTSNIILFSASRGRIETIQRMGRCLRTDPSNPIKKATVFDFILEKNDQKGEEKSDDADQERRAWLDALSKHKRRNNK